MFVFVLLCITLCPFWFCNHLEEEERTGCFVVVVFCLTDVLLLYMFCDSSSWCRGLICGVWLLYFLIILTYFFSKFINMKIRFIKLGKERQCHIRK